MSSVAWLVVFFFVLLFLSILVYVLVVRAFYWGDKKEPPTSRQKHDRKGVCPVVVYRLKHCRESIRVVYYHCNFDNIDRHFKFEI